MSATFPRLSEEQKMEYGAALACYLYDISPRTHLSKMQVVALVACVMTMFERMTRALVIEGGGVEALEDLLDKAMVHYRRTRGQKTT